MQFDDYIYRALRSKEELLGSDFRKIAMYKDCFDEGFRFPLHPFFILISNEFFLPTVR